MKHVKSVLALVMVLVIGVCMTGCQSAKEKEEAERLASESVSFEKSDKNSEFHEWFSSVSVSGKTLVLNYLSDNQSFVNNGYMAGAVTINGQNTILTNEDDTFQSAGEMPQLIIIGVRFDFEIEINTIDPQTLNIKMEFRNDRGVREADKDMTITYYF
jgi:hypothetical protein